MSDQAAPAPRRRLPPLFRALISLAIVALIISVSLGRDGLAYMERTFSAGHLHAPRLELIAQAPLVIRLHLFTILGAMALATVQMIGVKGTTAHRILGWTLSILVLASAVDALFIHAPGAPLFSPLQLFSVFVLVSVPLGIWAARKHRIESHRRAMTGLYFGGFILAGIIAFMPGRLMWRVFFE